MSTNDANDRKANGHGLPEDSRRRLNRLREDVTALLDLTRAHQPDEEAVRSAEVRMGELATRLTVLQKQMRTVLDDLSRLAARGECAREAGAESDDPIDRLMAGAEAPEAETSENDAAGDDPAECYVAGVTLNQIDEIALLLESIKAHGDVVTAADHAEYAAATLSIIGDAIYRETSQVRDILNTIDDDQRLQPRRVPRTRVCEEPATYLALPAYLPRGGTATPMREHPTYQ